MQINNILCPIDLSTSAQNVVKYAISFAGHYNTAIRFVHVSTHPPEVYYRFFPDVTGYLKSLEDDVQVQIEEFKKKLPEAIDINVRYGTVYQEILQYTQDEAIDLIILAAGGFAATHIPVLSTESQKVIRKAECPVLTLHGKRTEARIKRILCPVDLSDRSYRALDEAVELARNFQAKIYLVHVVEMHEFKKRRVKAYSSDEAFNRMSEMLKSEMKVSDQFSDVEIERVVRRNVDAAAEIVNYAKDQEIDLITLSTHGHGYWPRVLLGSVTEKVLQIAPCPVLTIRVKK
ncbi:universal stress protein [candidate division KSB1 bacterium]|nr:universal stress protein [candidate division KSB1 bacterium]